MIRRLLFLCILISPFTNILEVKGLFDGTLGPGSQSVALTPLYLKVLKDVCILLLLLLGIVKLHKTRNVKAPVAFFLFVILFFVSSFLTLLNSGWPSFIIGVRWFFPVMLFYIFYNLDDLEECQVRLFKPMTLVFWFGLVLQVAQLFFSAGYFGKNTFDLSIRNPGFYLIPSTMASFTAFFMYYSWLFSPSNTTRVIYSLLLGPISLFLTGSGSGILALVAFISAISYCRFSEKMKKVLLFAAPLLVSIVAMLLPIVTQRIGIYDSFFERIRILTRNISWENILFSSNSGRGTNSSNILNNFYGYSVVEDVFVADSTLTSIMVNLGFCAAISFLVLIYSRFSWKSEKWTCFVALTSPFIFSTIAFEVYPYNLLFFLNLAYLCQVTQKKRQLLLFTPDFHPTPAQERAPA
jgi:hypothetical protein